MAPNLATNHPVELRGGRAGAAAAVSRARNRIEVDNVSQCFVTNDDVVMALANFSFEVGVGEFVSLVGPSGCGKSTALGLISGLLPPTSGQVFVDRERVQGPNRHVGYMLQKDLLMPWRTILQNVMYGLQIRRVPRREAEAKAHEALRRYGLGAVAGSYPRQLSGGMRQRAALIRTLLLEPDIVLLDEPFSALDFQTRLLVEEDVRRILHNEGKTVLLITHDIGEAIAMSDRVIVMTAGPGRVKTDMRIELSTGHDSPLKAREAPEFSAYFSAIWKELDISVDIG
jgi:NitT/TauT family transport system ATP-binding protein